MLIIACGAYSPTTKLRSLAAPVAEAAELQQLFLDATIGGFDSVDVVVDKTSHEVSQALERFLTNGHLRKDDLVFVYFSGHGVKHEGLLYLAFSDMDPSARTTTAVNSELVDRLMRGCSAGKQVLVLDCCYSGAYEAAMFPKGDESVGVRDYFNWPAGMNKLRGRTVITSSDSFQYAFETEVNGTTRSIFTRELIAALRSGEAADTEGFVSLGSLFDLVTLRVSQHTSGQQPKMFHHGDSNRRLMIAHAPRVVTEKLEQQREQAKKWRRRNERIEAWRDLKSRLLRTFLALPRMLALVVTPILVVAAAAYVFTNSVRPIPAAPSDAAVTDEKIERTAQAVDHFAKQFERGDADSDSKLESVRTQLNELALELRSLKGGDEQKQLKQKVDEIVRLLVRLQGHLDDAGRRPPQTPGDVPAGDLSVDERLDDLLKVLASYRSKPAQEAGAQTAEARTQAAEAGAPVVEAGAPVVEAGAPAAEAGTPVTLDSGNLPEN